MLKQLVNQCSVTLRLEALEPLLIQSGGAVVNGPDMAFVRTQRGGRAEPFLPGSSLKGVVRSHAERIARTLKSGSVCDVFRGARVEGCSSRFEASKGPGDYRDSCPACRLFGSLHWKGRFNVGDGYLRDEDRDVQPEVRDGIGIDRISGGVAGGAKFDLEVMPAGVQFETRLDVVNFEVWMLGWLAYVLRDLAEGYVRIGSGTSRGLGRVRGHLDHLVLGYTGEPPELENRLPGIGGLVDPGERSAYGLRAEDFVMLPDGCTFERPAGALRSQHARTGSDAVLDLLAHLAPAWDTYIADADSITA